MQNVDHGPKLVEASRHLDVPANQCNQRAYLQTSAISVSAATMENESCCVKIAYLPIPIHNFSALHECIQSKP